ncbi:ABC transporter permease [Ornithinibacillus bavariensis]|uniref:Peptide ABC transporter permease n=1 Tax=Ornithinibacillus bavariensis TaxID=545502 RepID=A0A920C6L1_9BACI|nr:ABC transporter permease subunit [Ornithinibacillus bavariensis]GIO25797.1 peptide ABC transporter permease [Ornithinibacillus bavariensis]
MGNWRLWLGIIACSFLILIAIFGPFFAPYEKDYVEPTGYYYNSSDDFGFYTSPYPPSKKHLLGTDQWGYDILTLLLYGAKYTLFVGIGVAFLRILIGGSLGIWFGLSNKEKKKTKQSIFGLLGSIPAFLIVYFLLVGITINSSLSVMELVLLQSFLMVIIGFPGVYAATYSKTSELRKEQFIIATKALGAGKLRILWKHILPHLRGTLLVMFVKEIILVLTLIGQLGIFNLFLGGTIFRLGGGDPPVYISISRDWAGLIGQWRSFVYDSQWILYFPLLAFIFLLFSFYMLSRGIELKHKSTLQKFPHI